MTVQFSCGFHCKCLVFQPWYRVSARTTDQTLKKHSERLPQTMRASMNITRLPHPTLMYKHWQTLGGILYNPASLYCHHLHHTPRTTSSQKALLWDSLLRSSQGLTMVVSNYSQLVINVYIFINYAVHRTSHCPRS